MKAFIALAVEEDQVRIDTVPDVIDLELAERASAALARFVSSVSGSVAPIPPTRRPVVDNPFVDRQTWLNNLIAKWNAFVTEQEDRRSLLLLKFTPIGTTSQSTQEDLDGLDALQAKVDEVQAVLSAAPPMGEDEDD